MWSKVFKYEDATIIIPDSTLSEISGSRHALGKISSLTIIYSFYIKLPLCMYSKITRYTVRIYGQITVRTYGTNRKRLCHGP